MSTPHADWIWLDGEFVAWDDARVHILTHTLHYGLGVFEGTRVYETTGGGSAVFRLDDHLRRLRRSAKIMQIDMTWSDDALIDATLELVARNQLPSCYLRHLVFVGDGLMGLNPKSNPIRTAIIGWPWGAYLGDEGLEKGIRCRVSSFVRHHPNAMMNKAKACGGYLNSILAKREALRVGYDEAIMLDTNGFVAEGSAENLFVVRGNRLRTPPLTSALDGITRDTVMQLARQEGLTVEEAYMSRDELYLADEIFLTGTAAEVTPVQSVDDRPVGEGRPGPITRNLQARYQAAVRGELADRAAWLRPIPYAEV